MNGLPDWVARARRHALLARELDQAGANLLQIRDGEASPRVARIALGTARQILVLADQERQERDRLMQLQERA